MATATIPQTPARTVNVMLGSLTVHFAYGDPAKPMEMSSENLHVAADSLPPALVTWLESKIKARLERTE